MSTTISSTAPVRIGSTELASLIESIGEGVLDREGSDSAPFAAFDLIKRSRLGALRLPGPAGGGASLPEFYATVIDLAAADPNVAHAIRNHFHFVDGLIRRPSPEGDRLLELVRAGDIFGTAGSELNTSPAGQRVQPQQTSITASGTAWVLNGAKIYSTGNLYADWLVVSAIGPDGEPARVLVAGDAAGVVHVDDWDGIGQRFTGSGTTVFENVGIGADDFLSGNAGWNDLPYIGTFPQLFLTGVIAGILRELTADAIDLVRNKPRAYYHAVTENREDDPILQYSVGQLASQAFAAEALVLRAATDLAAATDASGTDDEDRLSLVAAASAAKAKVVTEELAFRASSDLFDVGGGSTVHRANHLDRHWRNIRTIAAHNPKTFKSRWIGKYEISGKPLPNGAFF